MARGTLHASKDPEQRRRRNAPTHGDIVLTRDGELRGPSIEDATGRNDWLLGTRKWWQTWREAPQAQVFEATDWQRLAMLASLVDAFQLDPRAAALSEIRLNEERLGATVIDRVRARMRIEEAERVALASVSSISGDSDAEILADL
jgi:hypothetical protein